MKNLKWLWFILGAIVLVALGFAIGFSLHFAPIGLRVMPMMGANGRFIGMRAPGLFFGLRSLFMLIFWLGPVAGIIALIVVLTRRNVPPSTPPAATPPTTTAEPPKTE